MLLDGSGRLFIGPVISGLKIIDKVVLLSRPCEKWFPGLAILARFAQSMGSYLTHSCLERLMQTRSRFFDDVSRVAGGALSVFSGLRHEVDILVRSQIGRIVANMDLVSRDEFESIKAVAATARAKTTVLEEKLAKLEERLQTLSRQNPVSRKKEKDTKKQPEVLFLNRLGIRRAVIHRILLSRNDISRGKGLHIGHGFVTVARTGIADKLISFLAVRFSSLRSREALYA